MIPGSNRRFISNMTRRRRKCKFKETHAFGPFLVLSSPTPANTARISTILPSLLVFLLCVAGIDNEPVLLSIEKTAYLFTERPSILGRFSGQREGEYLVFFYHKIYPIFLQKKISTFNSVTEKLIVFLPAQPKISSRYIFEGCLENRPYIFHDLP